MIETDIHMTKDGELVLIHDDTLDRTTDGKGHIRDLTFSEVKSLDAEECKDYSFGGERVPALIELLEAVKCNKDLLLNFELKDYTETVGRELAH